MPQTRRIVHTLIAQIFSMAFMIDYRCTLRREDLRDQRVYDTTGLCDLREMP